LYRPPADPAAFDAYYAETHIPLVKAIPGLQRLVLSKGPIVNVTGEAFHLAVDLHFASLEAAHAGLASPEGAAAAADRHHFATDDECITLLLDDQER
jgi:uncharacterized protein (TIGR02118 family)